MSSKKKAKAKKKKAAELARKNAVLKKAQEQAGKQSEDKKPAEKPSEEVLNGEAAIEIKEIVENAPAGSSKAKRVPDKKKSVKSKKTTKGPAFVSVIAQMFGKWKEKAGTGMYVSAAIGAVLLVTVIVLSVRLGGVTKELKAIQTMSVGYQRELQDVKQDLDEAELELFSKEPEKVYIEVYPTATPEPTPTPAPTPDPAKYVVCVDPGHGDWDGGASIVDENYRLVRAEKDDNLWMSKLFRDALLEYDGVEVIMTRETDMFLELGERTDIANEAEADVIISFHRNSYDGDAEVKGVEFWIHSSQPKGAKTLASRMLNAIMQVGGMANRGVKAGSMSSFREDYSINRKANMTSMIVELGFISNEQDNAAYDANGEAYAKEMAKVVYEWLVEQKSEND